MNSMDKKLLKILNNELNYITIYDLMTLILIEYNKQITI